MSCFHYVTNRPEAAISEAITRYLALYARLCVTYCPDDLFEGVVGKLDYFRVAPILNRMRDEYTRGFDSQCLGLRLGRIDKFA